MCVDEGHRGVFREHNMSACAAASARDVEVSSVGVGGEYRAAGAV